MKVLVTGILILLASALPGSKLQACKKCSSSDKCAVESALATPPAGCTLSSPEYSDRVSELELIFARRQAMRELDDGYAFQFPGDDVDLASRLTTWIVTERLCCSFFRFEQTFAADQGPIWVSVMGSQDAKDLVASLLKTPDTTTDQ